MATNSRIEWTDTTWNPVSGCTRVSAGCDNCYAVTMTRRLEAMGQGKYSGLVNPGKAHFNGHVRCHEDALLIPLRWRKPRRVFVNSMSDLFHKDVPFEFIDKVFAIMTLCPQHTFQVLTKRPERMAEYFAQIQQPDRRETIGALSKAGNPSLASALLDWDLHVRENNAPLHNVWLGTSVENQETADERIPHLLKCPAAVRFLSCEPLLGPVEFAGECYVCKRCGAVLGAYNSDPDELPQCKCGCDYWVTDFPSDRATLGAGDFGIHWIIVGGESGPNARPMHPDWARSLRDQCVAASVPLFFKQGSADWPKFKDFNSFPVDLQIREFPLGASADCGVRSSG